jgi:hypothetical protein
MDPLRGVAEEAGPFHPLLWSFANIGANISRASVFVTNERLPANERFRAEEISGRAIRLSCSN